MSAQAPVGGTTFLVGTSVLHLFLSHTLTCGKVIWTMKHSQHIYICFIPGPSYNSRWQILWQNISGKRISAMPRFRKCQRLLLPVLPKVSEFTTGYLLNGTLCIKVTIFVCSVFHHGKREQGANLFKLCNLYEGILHNTGTLRPKWAHIWK